MFVFKMTNYYNSIVDIKQKIRQLDIRTSVLVDEVFVWNYKTRFKGHWIEFADLREYEPWDDVKNIDWTITAKQNRPFVKKYAEERQLKSIFFLDIWDTMRFWTETKSKIDLMIEIFLVLAFSSLKNWDKVWALIFNKGIVKYVSPKRWKANILAILKVVYDNLESKSEAGVSDINNALAYLSRYKIKHSLIFALTDQTDGLNDKHLRFLGYWNDFLYVNVFDRFENTLDTQMFISLSWTWGGFELNTFDEKLVSSYLKNRKDKLFAFKVHLRKYRIDYLMLDNSSNIFEVFYKYFKVKRTSK